MNYKELADSVRHFKETEKGRDDMCKAVEEYGDKREASAKLQAVSNLMKSLKLTLDQALDALLITGDERTMIANQLK